MTQPSGDVAVRTAVIVLAGGKGTRLAPLTRHICKPALPFGGSLRCIDFSLSNAVNSGLRRIAVATQYKPDALLEHLWSRWNSVAVGDAPVIRAWRAEERAERFGGCGTAHAVYRNFASIRDVEDSLVLILAGDHVYKMDYRPLLESHVARDADITIACVKVPLADCRRLGCLTVGDDARVERFVEKPRDLADVGQACDGEVLASMGIYVFGAKTLADVLATDATASRSGHDFSADILPQLLAGGAAYAYEFREAGSAARAYWRDIGTLQSYWQAHMDLLGPAPLLTLDDPAWPLGRVAANTRSVVGTAATADGGTLVDSIVATSCNVRGHVQRSVLSGDVEVACGARICEAVVLPGAVIGSDCRLRGVIVDAGYRVPDGTLIERHPKSAEPVVLSRRLDAAARERNM
jgi:glucose-1-phosphate adenylyltransferase